MAHLAFAFITVGVLTLIGAAWAFVFRARDHWLCAMGLHEYRVTDGEPCPCRACGDVYPLS